MSNNTTIHQLIEQSGLNQERKTQLFTSFDEFIEIARHWEEKAKEIVVKDVSEKALMQQAREGRLLLREKRLQIEDLRKTIKEQPLRECQAIDSIARTFKEIIEPIESYLKEQEEFEKRVNEKRAEDRKALLLQYGASIEGLDLVTLNDAMFDMILKNAKYEFEEIQKAKAQEEERKRLETEAEKKRVEEQRIENERLQKLAKEQAKKLEEAKEKERKAKQQAEQAKERERKAQEEAKQAKEKELKAQEEAQQAKEKARLVEESNNKLKEENLQIVDSLKTSLKEKQFIVVKDIEKTFNLFATYEEAEKAINNVKAKNSTYQNCFTICEMVKTL
jgi:nucleolar protein involved in exit from mitosis